jgi:hypothetical protein
VLARLAPAVCPQVVLADPSALNGTAEHDALRREAESRGGQLVVAPVSTPEGGSRHDARLLAAALRTVLGDLLAPDESST